MWICQRGLATVTGGNPLQFSVTKEQEVSPLRVKRVNWLMSAQTDNLTSSVISRGQENVENEEKIYKMLRNTGSKSTP